MLKSEKFRKSELYVKCKIWIYKYENLRNVKYVTVNMKHFMKYKKLQNVINMQNVKNSKSIKYDNVQSGVKFENYKIWEGSIKWEISKILNLRIFDTMRSGKFEACLTK
jgi:hypothetical protein